MKEIKIKYQEKMDYVITIKTTNKFKDLSFSQLILKNKKNYQNNCFNNSKKTMKKKYKN